MPISRAVGLISAMLMVSAAMASAASASAVTAESYPTIITGGQIGSENYVEVGGVKVECGSVLSKGTLSEASSVVSLTKEYKECESSLGTSVTVDDNTCKFDHTPAIGLPHTYSGTVHLKCPTGKDYTITMGFCTIHIASQTFKKSSVYTNVTNPFFRNIYHTNSNMNVTITNVFLCPMKTGEQEGTYVASEEILGYQDIGGSEGSSVGVWID